MRSQVEVDNHGKIVAIDIETGAFEVADDILQTKLITAGIDTGYTGFLSLPSEIIAELGLSWSGIDRATLGDSSEVR